MNLFDIESKLDGIADLCLGSGIDTGCERRVVNIKIQEDFSAQKLTDIDLALENRSALFRNGLLVQIRDMLGTNADGNSLAIIAAVNDRLCLCGCQRNVNACNRNACLAAVHLDNAVNKVHLRRSHEACNEEVAGIIIKVLRRVDLLNNAVLHYDDSGAQCHSLGLVMCYIDDRCAESLMELGDFGSHLNTELRVQVGERLVHQEYFRVTDNSTSHRDTLSLAAGKSLGLTVEELCQIQNLRRVLNHRIDLILRNLAELEAECHVVIHGHMRIQRVVLENHRDITVLGLYIIHDLAVNLECAARDIFKPCDHAQCCRLSAAGRSYKDDEFLVLNIQIEILDSFKSIGILFVNVLQIQTCH